MIKSMSSSQRIRLWRRPSTGAWMGRFTGDSRVLHMGMEGYSASVSMYEAMLRMRECYPAHYVYLAQHEGDA